ncbi:MAG: hypothetical protein JNK09_01685 [Prolixibacteraceae bacterium]|nr:hypothetical protein [Prolixibacteraceae bacterium]
MVAIKYVKRKIGQSYIVWFNNSNLYTQLEEPAWFVFQKVMQRYKTETIASICSYRYDLDYNECLQFTIDIRNNINQMNQTREDSGESSIYPIEVIKKEFTSYSIHKYRFAKNTIEFRVEKERFESFLHPLIGYLETGEIGVKHSLFELFEYQNKIVFRLNGEIKGLWEYEEAHRLIGFIYMCLINEIYDKTENFWLMTVHAAALTNGRKTILIPAESGSGKTTMAAMLQKKGYKLISDDFVPIDKDSRAWPFPIAMSVKEGAMNLISSIYPDLAESPLTKTNAKKTVRYLNPTLDYDISTMAFPIHEVISIKYDPSVEFEFGEADRLKSIKLMLDQSWILPNSGNAEIFLELVSKWSFYQLTYSNNTKALDKIAQLFNND